MKDFVFFSDFDGTITKEDTLNKFLQLYAYPEWIDVENKWLEGKIGSKECIEKQMQMFPPINDKIIDDFDYAFCSWGSVGKEITKPNSKEFAKEFYIKINKIDYKNKVKQFT